MIKLEVVLASSGVYQRLSKKTFAKTIIFQLFKMVNRKKNYLIGMSL